MKFFLAFWLFSTLLFAQSYNFTELRYSDAINHYTQLEGKIAFQKDGLDIQYPKTGKELHYKDGELHYFENGKEISLSDIQAGKIIQYFDILMLVHSGDENELKDMFSLEKANDEDILKPLGSLKDYIDHIILRKENNSLQYMKLFLQNSDTISITINNETP